MEMYCVTVLTLFGFQTTYEFADTATEAIAQVRKEFGVEIRGAISARKAFYGEQDCGAENFLLDGTHLAH